MNIKEIEENGTIDYYLELKKYIDEFVNRNYPLSQDDFRSILKNTPSENVVQRQETYRILNEAMEEALTNVEGRNAQIINGANEGNYTEFSINDLRQEIFQIKQEMLGKLWEAQHQEERTGGNLIEEVVDQSVESGIRADEISEANREINQAERDFIEQQQPDQDMGISIGE